jgi:hypothetical protein
MNFFYKLLHFFDILFGKVEDYFFIVKYQWMNEEIQNFVGDD